MNKLSAIYDRIPQIQCKGLCYEACGPIGIMPAEAQAIMGSGHPLPKAIESLRHGRLACSALDRDRRCRIYQNRPAICRLYGAVEALRCQHGCKPERWMTDAEAAQLLEDVRALSVGPGGIVLTVDLPKSGSIGLEV